MRGEDDGKSINRETFLPSSTASISGKRECVSPCDRVGLREIVYVRAFFDRPFLSILARLCCLFSRFSLKLEAFCASKTRFNYFVIRLFHNIFDIFCYKLRFKFCSFNDGGFNHVSRMMGRLWDLKAVGRCLRVFLCCVLI
jgi:hypothetical protein